MSGAGGLLGYSFYMIGACMLEGILLLGLSSTVSLNFKHLVTALGVFF